MKDIINELIIIEEKARDIARSARDAVTDKQAESRLRLGNAEAAAIGDRQTALLEQERKAEAELSGRLDAIKAKQKEQSEALKASFQKSRVSMAKEIYDRVLLSMSGVKP